MNRVVLCGLLWGRLRRVSHGKCQVENLAAAATGDSGKCLLVRAELLLLVCLTACGWEMELAATDCWDRCGVTPIVC